MSGAPDHLRRIIESAIDFAIIATDVHGIITDWNQGATNILGWTAEEIVGHPADRFFTPEDRAADRPRAEMRLTLRDGRASDERWHMRADGSHFWASGEMMPLRDDDGTHRGFVKIMRDRTGQREAGERLRESQDRFKTLLETVETAFAIVEVKFDAQDRPVDYRFVEANPAFEREAGVNLRGKWVTEFAPDLEQFWFDTYGRVALTGEPATFENYAEAFGRWFDVRALRVGLPAERQIAIFFNDVTARKEAEKRLRASEALARENAERVQLALAAGAIIGTWHWDLPTDRFTVDQAFAIAFGLDPALGRSGLSLQQVIATVHPDDRPGLVAAIDEVIRRGGSYAHRYRVRRADGHYYWIEANGRVDHAADGTPTNFPGVLIDVQERRALEEERDRNAAALRALNETLEQRVAERTAELMRAEEQLRQSQKMEAVGQLTGGLAHDFNNLLAGISGSLELMQARMRRGQLDDLERYLTVAQGATRRAAALTHRLLAFSRRQTLSPVATNVNQLIGGMEDLIRRTIGPAVALEVVGADGLWPALIDVSQLENALLNLCINSRDAMPHGGRITIETANRWLDRAAAGLYGLAEGQYLCLSVTDTGAGMSPDIIARVFEPFFTTKPIGQGTGLGLSMIHGFAQQSGGQVRIYSEVGQGTTVSLYMPRHHGEVGADAAARELVGPAPAAPGETVLVVDDEPSVRMLVVEVLDDLGYRAIEAADSAAGLKILRSNVRIDLLVTDVGLPGGMNGRQMADAGRQLRPELKVLFITGYAENSVINGGHLEPGMQVLTKPFPVESLGAAVKELIASGTDAR
ncbi:PAS domain S-box protein [Xylophilus sp. GOD-11R]|uniref:PAS domain S-box protein n=1 Tax=Xylophilus sp. GOD-11R TaxID=3089814 RepID=UPI00298CE35E|nr:PAS domain S-box protein [Xylophilus sp. GOD-11R]WPB58412.1 PAS domain S-box protein [Xylophilus sp. GOD-11R]